MMRRYTARQIFCFAETDVRRLTLAVRFVLAPLAKSLGKPGKGGKKPPTWRGSGGRRGRKSGDVVVDLDADDSLEGVNAQIAHLGMKL